jgi:hypothetical protein
MPGLDPHSIGLLAPRARQTVGVQQLDQEPVARAWVHQVHDREIHLPASKTTATEHRRTLTLDRRMGKEQFHPDGLMSQIFSPSSIPAPRPGVNRGTQSKTLGRRG